VRKLATEAGFRDRALLATLGAKVADEIEVKSFVGRRIDRARRTRHQKSVTVLRLLGLLWFAQRSPKQWYCSSEPLREDKRSSALLAGCLGNASRAVAYGERCCMQQICNGIRSDAAAGARAMAEAP
jgi:hypothetical protein